MSSSEPRSVAIGDLNSDGLLDIVVANSGTSTVGIFLTSSGGNSADEQTYSTGTESRPSSVVISDFNNDNHSDIAVANYATNNIGLFLGNGNGTFNDQNIFSLGSSHPLFVTVGDFNQDNRTDIVVVNYGTNNIGILLGYGNGSFQDQTTYSTGYDSIPYSVAVGYFNKDNRLDIAVANYGTNNIGIFLGYGNGTFADQQTYTTLSKSNPSSIAVGDFNNDNQTDIVVSNNGTGNVGLFLGQGNGSFRAQTTYSMGSNSYPQYISVSDFNKDNALDIVVVDSQNDYVHFVQGYGNGSFSIMKTYDAVSGSSPCCAIVADLNNDNEADIVIGNYGTNDILLLIDYFGSLSATETKSYERKTKTIKSLDANLDHNNKLGIVPALQSTRDVAVLTKPETGVFSDVIVETTGSAPKPFSVAVGDFNNDNRSDVVVANSGTDDLSILLNFGNGTLGNEMQYFIGYDFYPQYVITCDIDKDNKLDIVSVNSKDNSISVIMGYGNGSFAAQIVYPTGGVSRPYAVVAGDFNNDNWLDLVVANEGTNSIGILFGFNYTQFQNQGTYSSINSLGATGMVVSDFNNDTFLDIAAVFEKSNNLAILLGYGNGSFSAIISYSIGNHSSPSDMAMGDFNKDSRLDIVSANAGTNNVGIFLGYGNGSFAPVMTYSTGDNSDPYGVEVGDFNNDSWLDIVVANHVNGSVGVLLGYGNGNFSIVKLYSTGNNSGSSAVTVGDFDNDGNLDIAVANSNTDNIGVLFGHGDGTFKNQITFSTGNSSAPFDVTVGDFNSDNHLDIATALSSDNSVGILIGYGNGTFADIEVYSTGDDSSPRFLRVADFNSDKILDIVVVSFGSNSFVVLFGVGDGTFLLGKSFSTDPRSPPYVLAVGDFNNDTELDIAVGNNFANDIVVFLADGSEPFASAVSYTTGDGSQPHLIDIGDLNNDGCSDIITANYGSDNIGVFFGHKNGTFDPITTYPTGNGSAPYSVVVADFNNDHNLDVVVANSETNNILILFGSGNGTFPSEVTYSTGTYSSPYTATIGDFNNDNISDIAVANAGSSNVFLLYGYGNGTFGNETSYPLGYDYLPYSIAVIDLNPDNWMDLVIACYGTDHIETLMKSC